MLRPLNAAAYEALRPQAPDLRRLHRGALKALFALLTCLAGPVLAQTPSSPAASAPIADHVKRAAERPYYWIRVNAQPPEPPAPRAKPAARAAPKTATPASATTAPASGITERVTPLFESPALATSAEPAASDKANELATLLEAGPPASGQTTPAVSAQAAASAPAIGPSLATTAADPDPVSRSAAPAPSDGRATLANQGPLSPPLRLLSQVEPDFPSALQRRLRQGAVEVAFTVLPDGSVTALSVLRSSHPRLEAPALEAVALWRFAPMVVAKPGVVEVGFNLDP